ncbi:M1 family metallopeptidase [Wenyingzhuangia sp. IMCC45533]
MFKFNIVLFLLFCSTAQSQQLFTKQDSIRGSITPERNWWDVKKYNLAIDVYPEKQAISGKNSISYQVLKPDNKLQFELQEPLVVDSVIQNNIKLNYQKTGMSYFVALEKKQIADSIENIHIYYHGKPKEATNPPWDGGITWSKDLFKKPFIASANQAIGASVWWPCKDHPADEADEVEITVTAPDPLISVSNGRCTNISHNANGTNSYTWKVNSPINNYGVSINIANYAHFSTRYKGTKGYLDCNYYVLSHNFLKAKTQFRDVDRTLSAFEYWLGPYPFYKDGYKLVEVPYLGMEHQSCIGYGNHYKNGYLGKTMGLSDWALKFDYIIIHETAHEWFANSITCKDVADLWIHESFATYAESLFVEYFYQKQAANEYVQGLKPYVKNDRPIVGTFNVHHHGSGDMYFKGSLMLHTLRNVINNDQVWKQILRGLNKTFYHKTVSGRELIGYINNKTEVNVLPFFKQYLHTTKIPELLVQQKGEDILYKWNQVVDDFEYPIKVYINKTETWITPKKDGWSAVKGKLKSLKIDPNFYITKKEW